MSRSLLLAAPSVPRPTGTPARRNAGTGAVPLASFMLLSGLCETPTPRAFRMSMSFGLTWTTCAASVRGPKNPIESRNPTGVALCFSRRDLHLVLGFGEMDDDRHVLAIGELPHLLQRLGLEGIHRVRRDRRHDQIVGGELLDESFGARQPLFGGLRVRDRKLDDGLAEHAAQSRGSWSRGQSPPRSNTCPRRWWSPSGSSRARPAGCRRGRTPASRSWPRPGRCISAASPSAPGRRPGRDRAPSAHGCGC